tara:strand:- start:1277 stop:1588 length:312 start_codon:yes stop_codon:yes gene_type:complete
MDFLQDINNTLLDHYDINDYNINDYNINDYNIKEYNCGFEECNNYNKDYCNITRYNVKIRKITKYTNAGKKNWTSLIGKQLCDSCYTCYRKNGSFKRKYHTKN